METVTIPRDEYDRLKAIEKVQWDIVGEFKESLQDFQEGRFTKC